MARQSKSARAAAAATEQNTLAHALVVEEASDVKNAKMEAIAKHLEAYDRSVENVKLRLVLFKALPGIISSDEEYLAMSRLIVEARVARARPGFNPDTLRRRRVPMKEATSKKVIAAYQFARMSLLNKVADSDSDSENSQFSTAVQSTRPSSPPASTLAAKVTSSKPQESANKNVKVKPSSPAAAQSAEIMDTPTGAKPEVESPSPATKIFAAESAKFKSRRTRKMKAKVPASPSPKKSSKQQTTPALPSTEFEFRSETTPTKQASIKADSHAFTLSAVHVRSFSESSLASVETVSGRSRGESPSSLDEDKPSTGKTTPHRLSEASDKPYDLFNEFAPEPNVDSKTHASNHVSIEETLGELAIENFHDDEDVLLPSIDDLLLAAVADDTIPRFFERVTGGLSTISSVSCTYEDRHCLHKPMTTFGKTIDMVKQMMHTSSVLYLEKDDEAHNIKLVNVLDVYHHSSLPKMVLSSDQVEEQAAFDSAMSKYRQNLVEQAAQESALPKAPQTTADAQLDALFAIGLQSVVKNGTCFFNPSYKPFSPVVEEVMDIEEDPAIVSMVASLPSGTGLAATLARLGPNRPLAPWPKSAFVPTMAEASIFGLDATIARLRAREAAQLEVAVQALIPAPIAIEPVFEASSAAVVLKHSPMDGCFSNEVPPNATARIFTAPLIEEPVLATPMPKEQVNKAPIAADPAATTTQAHPQPVKGPKPYKAKAKTITKLTGPRTHDSLSKKEKRAMKKAGLL